MGFVRSQSGETPGRRFRNVRKRTKKKSRSYGAVFQRKRHLDILNNELGLEFIGYQKDVCLCAVFPNYAESGDKNTFSRVIKKSGFGSNQLEDYIDGDEHEHVRELLNYLMCIMSMRPLLAWVRWNGRARITDDGFRAASTVTTAGTAEFASIPWQRVWMVEFCSAFLCFDRRSCFFST